MKLLNRDEFLKMPPGTLFAKGTKWCFEGLCAKGFSIKNESGKDIDFFYTDLISISCSNSQQFFDRLEQMFNYGKSYPMNISQSRDGCFNEKEIFLVYEDNDLSELAHFIAIA